MSLESATQPKKTIDVEELLKAFGFTDQEIEEIMKAVLNVNEIGSDLSIPDGGQ
jgi:Holliday junction resolvasome RuvABC DNA-binding subunit